MSSFLAKYKHLFLLILIFFLAELIIDPLREFPLNDDWSYAKSTLVLHNEGHINIGNWGAMTLVTHLLWGVSFTKLFGFSFIVLRCSTLLSSLTGILTLYVLLKKITGEWPAFFATLVLFFNPLYFNLSNTYMTDVNFNTLVILFVYVSHAFFRQPRFVLLLPVLLLSALLVFLRQFGIVAPICFAISCLFLSRRRWLFAALSVFIIVAVYGGLKIYEHSLSQYLAAWSPYKYSDHVKFTDAKFWETLANNFTSRYKTIGLLLLIYGFPFSLIYIKSVFCFARSRSSWLGIITAVLISGFLCLFLNQGGQFPYMNIFLNMCLGPETFYESWFSPLEHSYSKAFKVCCEWIRYIFSFLTLFVFTGHLLLHGKFSKIAWKPFHVFLFGFFLAYLVMLLISESFFDRYLLPPLTFILIAGAWFFREKKQEVIHGVIALLLYTYVSVAGTLDYMNLNSLRWEAYHWLRNKNIITEKINGGFEVNCWNEGRMNWWYEFTDLNKFDYLIQFKPEPGFVLMRELPFQRYFPFKEDKINIFARREPQ